MGEDLLRFHKRVILHPSSIVPARNVTRGHNVKDSLERVVRFCFHWATQCDESFTVSVWRDRRGADHVGGGCSPVVIIIGSILQA